MIDDLTMLANAPVDAAAVEQVRHEEAKTQQPEPAHPVPGLPTSREQPVVPPDDPHRRDVDREPRIDPPPTDPPVEAPSETPGISEPPRPRA